MKKSKLNLLMSRKYRKGIFNLAPCLEPEGKLKSESF